MVKSRVKILEQKGTVEELSGKRFDPGLVNLLVNRSVMLLTETIGSASPSKPEVR